MVSVPPVPRHTDVFIVGGGPAGLAAAIAARQQGMQVVVADRARPPIDKACGEGLMPDSVALLRALGIDLKAYESAPFQGIRFIDARHSVAARFPWGQGTGVRRTVLHQALVDRARELGALLLWNTRVSGARDGTVHFEGRTVHTRWIVGADGQNSQVRRWARLSAGREYTRRIGLRRHFLIAPWTDYVEVHWGDAGQAYVTPIGDRQICVALIFRRRPVSFHAALAQFPLLEARLQDSPPGGGWRGSLTVSRRLRSVYRKGTVLIGEASGSADAVTGEGLALCFRQALALGCALARHDPAMYETAHRSIMREPRWMGRVLLLLDGHVSLRHRVFRALEAKPGLFARFLSVHVGEVPLTRFGVNGIFNLGRQLLTG